MNTFTKTEVFLSVFVQKLSSVNGALKCLVGCGVISTPTWMIFKTNILNILRCDNFV